MAGKTKSEEIIAAAREILWQYYPMTVRQVYYQLVSTHLVENSRSQYQAVGNALVKARKEGDIPWHWVEDRLRKPRKVSMWDDLKDFGQSVKISYRRDVWQDQDYHYAEFWLEKDALSGIFEDILEDYGYTLNVGRGYDGWSSIRNAAVRFQRMQEDTGRALSIYYFGDFDPSGEDMVRSLRERLGFFGVWPEITKCALTREDIRQYDLPPDVTKRTDTRREAFVAEHGDVSVELDALSVPVLREKIRTWAEQGLDMEAYQETRSTEQQEISKLEQWLATF